MENNIKCLLISSNDDYFGPLKMKIIATDSDSTEHQIDFNSGDNLMEIVRDAGLEVSGTCGGMASCGTCHVFVEDSCLERSGQRSEDEGYMLEALAEVTDVRENSRLCCQITLSEEMDNLQIEVAPEI